MCDSSDTKSLAYLFTKGSHHRNVTILYLVHNLFDQGKSSRTVSLKSHYIVAFHNLRDPSQFRTMAAQLLPKTRSGLWMHMRMPPQYLTDILSSTIAHSPHSDPVFYSRQIFSAKSWPRCIAIEKPCIKDRDHRLQIKLNRRTDKQIKIEKGP